MKIIPLLLITPLLFAPSCQEEKTSSGPSDPDSEDSSIPPVTRSSRPPGNSRTKSKRTATRQRAGIKSAREALALLINATDAFYETYQYLPKARLSAVDSTVTTGKPVMTALLGLRVAQDENPRFLNFFPDLKPAKDSAVGLIRTQNSAELLDPWGTPYHLLMNYDNDNQLRDPFDTSLVLFDRRVLAWSNGPDGQSGTPETNKDNVYSWNRD